MMYRVTQAFLAGLLALASLAALGGVQPALALDETLTTCDWATFEPAIAAIQADGGGTLMLDCSGTIVFANQITITTDVTIIGQDEVVLSGNDSTRHFYVNAGASLELVGLSVQDGQAFNAGAILNFGALTITNSSFRNNSAVGEAGGALVNRGTLTITASTFSNNSAPDGIGGAIDNADSTSTLTITASTFSVNSARLWGGAIYNGGPATITASTFSINSAFSGGAIRNVYSLTISASTFSVNSATNGGAISHTNFAGIPLTVVASTFSDNSANRGGAIYLNEGSTSIRSSILANSTGGNCVTSRGTLTSNGYNLTDDASCNPHADDIINSTSISLGALADNGGPTQTMLPALDSDAINAADCALSTAFDQRGEPRPTNGLFCDIGAVELGPNTPVQIFSFDATSQTDGLAEGDSLAVRAVAYGPNNDNLAYALDCDGDGSYETSLAVGGTHVSGACSFIDDGSFAVGIQVCDTSNTSNCDHASLAPPVSVSNVAPTITAITTDGPVAQGAPVTLSVEASDPGLNDLLSYSFDCDNLDGYETPGNGNQGVCRIDPAAASATINVLVEDGDGGKTIGSVTVSQTATLCANRYTGALSAPSAGGACPSGFATLSVPGPNATAFCISLYTGAIVRTPGGVCPSGYRVHVVPDDGPLAYCQSLYTGQLRYAANGSCGAYERPGVIPG